MQSDLIRKDIIFPELSYKIVGILFEVFNQLGYKYQEKYYQRAISQSLKTLNISFIYCCRSMVRFSPAFNFPCSGTGFQGNPLL